MTLSLNAGAELDEENPGVHVDVPKTEQEYAMSAGMVPVEPPGLDGDLNILLGLESRLHDLAYLAQDVARTHGMSQAFALETERLLPGFTQTYPVGYFSKDASATLYQVSLEEINKGLWALIAAAAVAVMAMLYKLIGWLTGKGNSDAEAKKSSASLRIEASENIEEAATDIKEQAKALDEESNALKEAVRELDQSKEVIEEATGHKIPRSTLNEITEVVLADTPNHQHAVQFLAAKDPIFYDICTQGPYSKAALSVMKHLDQVILVLQDKLSLIDAVRKADLADPSSVQTKVNNTEALRSLKKPIEIRIDGKQRSAQEIATWLGEERAKAQRQTHHQEMPLEQIVERLNKSYQQREIEMMYQTMNNSLDTFMGLRDGIAAIEEQVGTMHTDGKSGHNSQGIAGELRSILLSVGRDVAVYGKIVFELEHYLHSMRHMATQVEGILDKVFSAIIAFHKRNGTPPPEGYERLVEILEGSKKRKGSGLAGFFGGRRKAQ